MHQIWYTKYTKCTGRMANVQWSIGPVQDVWLTYTAYTPCAPSILYHRCTKFGTTCTWRKANVQWSRHTDVHSIYTMCTKFTLSKMHQIWYTKYTTCTWRMANVQWIRQPVQKVWLTYTAYSPCSPCIPYVSSVICGLMCAPNLEHQVYDRVWGVADLHSV